MDISFADKNMAKTSYTLKALFAKTVLFQI